MTCAALNGLVAAFTGAALAATVPAGAGAFGAVAVDVGLAGALACAVGAGAAFEGAAGSAGAATAGFSTTKPNIANAQSARRMRGYSTREQCFEMWDTRHCTIASNRAAFAGTSQWQIPIFFRS